MWGRFPRCSRIIVDHPPSDARDEPPGGEETARVERRLEAAHERDALSRVAPYVDLRLHVRRRPLDHERAAARLEPRPERRDEPGDGARLGDRHPHHAARRVREAAERGAGSAPPPPELAPPRRPHGGTPHGPRPPPPPGRPPPAHRPAR